MLKWILGAAAIVVAVLAIRAFATQRDAEWQIRVERESARAEIALARGDSLRQEANELQGLADSYALLAEQRDTVIQRVVERIPVEVPADCEPFTAPRDTAILLLTEQVETVTGAFEAERQAAGRLRAAEAQARMAADSLLSVLDDRPRPLSPLIPSVGLGCTAGLSVTTRAPDAACGLTLSWEVRLF